MSNISEANKELKQSLEAMVEISRIILNSGVFEPKYNQDYLQHMQELQEKSIHYLEKLEQLQKHSNLINFNLFSSFNDFFQKQAELTQQTTNMFDVININKRTMELTARLIPQLSKLINHTGKAMINLQELQENTLKGFDKIVENSPSYYFENMLSGLLKNLPEMIKSYRSFTDVLQNSVQNFDLNNRQFSQFFNPQHKGAAKKSSKPPAKKPLKASKASKAKKVKKKAKKS
jgi:hypothetical protein